MNTKQTFSILTMAMLLMMTLVVPARAATQAGDDEQADWVAAWRTTISPIPGDPTQFPAFPGLLTINQEKTLSESDGSQLVPVPAGALGPNELFATGGHGAWRELGAHKFAIKIVQIVVNGNDNTLFGTVTLQFTVKVGVDGNHFQGKGALIFADANGNIIFSGNEQISGERIAIQ